MFPDFFALGLSQGTSFLESSGLRLVFQFIINVLEIIAGLFIVGKAILGPGMMGGDDE